MRAKDDGTELLWLAHWQGVTEFSITEPTGSDYLCPGYGQLNVATLMSRRQQLVLSHSLSPPLSVQSLSHLLGAFSSVASH